MRWNASRSDRGRTRTLTTGTRRARASFQKGVFGTSVAPEGLPSRDGRSVNTKKGRKVADSARRWTLPHGADQDHHGTKVDLSAEKTDRWRRRPLSAAIAITAEAEPRAVLRRQMVRPAPRYPRVVGRVQATTARASFLPSRIGQVLVDRQKERPETSTSMQLMPYRGVLLGLRTVKEDTPCQGSRLITLSDSGSRQNLK